ncbi:hypothetical protein SUBVAR_05934 [Subdoligranulum variabile DSM 15176]|uniref:Uncharacterized protein n=1 Tax=Subdoligranulum variabile DSM 15176 TaxID=411471 RepID=D1PNL2_9FIRM|nr:hypothetical protein SUBVAR_05934 [Subdoligranulum variabile DSM 15176]
MYNVHTEVPPLSVWGATKKTFAAIVHRLRQKSQCLGRTPGTQGTRDDEAERTVCRCTAVPLTPFYLYFSV